MLQANSLHTVQKGNTAMSAEENKANARRIFEGINQGNLAVIDELCAPTFVSHSPPTTTHGPEAYKQSFSIGLTAFPDSHFTIEDQLAEGDKVATRYTFSGTHQGEFMGIPPTGKHVTFTGISISHWVDGKLVENWINSDTLGYLQQLGVIPSLG
jgi:predicted ester cyclase